MKYKVLDLFCGLGGWSRGFAANGFNCTGVDIEPKPYPFKFIQEDITNLDGSDFRNFDVIIGSPPCTDFSTLTLCNKSRRDRNPPDPQRGLILVSEFRRLVAEAAPRLWAMENVWRLTQFYKPKPIWKFYVSRGGRRALWGNLEMPLVSDIRFPNRLIAASYDHISGFTHRSELRSEIPFAIADLIARVCKSALQGKKLEWCY